MFLLLLKGHALIRYNNLGSAVYAKEKLNGFEYPPGNRLVVTFYDDGEDRSRYQMHTAIVFIFGWLQVKVSEGGEPKTTFSNLIHLFILKLKFMSKMVLQVLIICKLLSFVLQLGG